MSQTILDTSDLAKTIKEARLKMGMSQRELAKKSGIGNATVSTIEAGTATNINVRTLLAISGTLGLSLKIDS